MKMGPNLRSQLESGSAPIRGSIGRDNPVDKSWTLCGYRQNLWISLIYEQA